MRGTHLLALAVPAVLALGLLLPQVLRMEFLSDDYVLVNLLEADGRSMDWGGVGSWFGERWLYSQAYWRPVVNLVYGLNVTLTGFTPVGLGLGNLLMHLTVVVATAELAFRLAGGARPLLAAWLAAGCVAVHPATVETVLWISARVTGVEVMFRMLALCAFLAHLRRPSVGRYLGTALLAALALGAKESAVVLPFALLAVDLLENPRRPLRDRLRLHLPLVPLWLGYAVLRVALLGSFVGSPVPDPGPGELAAILAPKLELLFAPSGQRWLLLAWGLVAMAMLAAPWIGRPRPTAAGLRAVVLLGWIAACLAPTYRTPLGAGFVGSRMLYDALPVVGLLLGLALAAAGTRPGRLAVGGLAVLILAMAVPPAGRYARAFDAAWQQNASARAGLAALGAAAGPENPLGILSFPPCREVPGPIHPVSYFVLGRPPFTEPAYPALGLGAILDRFPFSPAAYRDPRPLHALLDAGATIAWWDETGGLLRSWRRDPSAASAAGSGPELRFDPPLGPLDLEGLEIVASAEVEGGSLTWLTNRGEFGGPAGIAFAGGRAEGGRRTFRIDATRSAPLLALALAGGELSGVRIEAGGIEAIRALRRLPVLPLAVRLDGRRIPLADLDGALVAPEGDPLQPMFAVLAGEATTFVLPCAPGQPVALSDELRGHIRTFARALRARTFWYWFETEPPQGEPGSARSPIDRFVVGEVRR
jgi:hypothetical protein